MSPMQLKEDVRLSSHRKSWAKCQDMLLCTFKKNKQNTYWIGGGLLAGIVWVKELARTMKLYFDSSSFNSDWTSSLSLCNSKEEAGSWGSPPGREQTKCTQDMLYTWWLNFLWLRNFCHLKRSNVKCIETSISHDILYIVLRFSHLYYSE